MSRPYWIAALDGTALAGYVVALAARVPELELSLWQPVVGYVLADALSGITHWFADSQLSEVTPVVGRVLIHPFRDHHRDPAALTRHGLLELCGNSALCSIPLLFLPLPATFLTTLTLALVLTNLFHRWAHDERPPAAARILQRWKLILNSASHARHHANGRGAYCVTNGWFNPVLDRLTAGK